MDLRLENGAEFIDQYENLMQLVWSQEVQIESLEHRYKNHMAKINACKRTESVTSEKLAEVGELEHQLNAAMFYSQTLTEVQTAYSEWKESELKEQLAMLALA